MSTVSEILKFLYQMTKNILNLNLSIFYHHICTSLSHSLLEKNNVASFKTLNYIIEVPKSSSGVIMHFTNVCTAQCQKFGTLYV